MDRRKPPIRVATTQDAEALLAIYAPYVEHTAVTFEYTVPTAEEFAGRIRHVLARYPYLIAEADGEILGYAYASAFHSRAAYDWAVEVSLYVNRDRRRTGIGGALYEALERVLSVQNILNLNACIAYPEKENEYLTRDSVAFHQHFGYEMVGEFHQCGYKFNRWYNMVWMEKIIGDHISPPSPVVPFPDLNVSVLQSMGIE